MTVDIFFAVIFYTTLIVVLVYGFILFKRRKNPDFGRKKRKKPHPFD